ncbi:hypothetical protein pb186bvf_016392 [Paramecium bursaria]
MSEIRYSQMTEEQAAQQFEQRKQQLLGNLIEQYKGKKAQNIPKSDKDFTISNQKNDPKTLYGMQQKSAPKKLKFIPSETPTNDIQENIIESIIQPPQPQKQEETLYRSPVQKTAKKMLLSEIGNLDLEIQRLTKEAESSSVLIKPTKPYYELRQRPSSKESRISDQSYTKRATCFKGVVRSQSLKKLNTNQPPPKQYNILQVRSASEKKVDNSVNKTVTVESEKPDLLRKQAQSERKMMPPKPIIQLNRSQSKQEETSKLEASKIKQSTPRKSNLKVQWKPQGMEVNSTKANSSMNNFHNHKESFTSQASFTRNKCVEAQIEEAVQLYNTLKSIIGHKTNVLQARKEQNLIPRKTVDFFANKVQKPIC